MTGRRTRLTIFGDLMCPEIKTTVKKNKARGHLGLKE